MQSTYGKRPGPGPLPVRPPSYEIKVTREVSVDSRPESRKKMHYSTFPPNAAVKPRAYNAITQARISAESTNSKPFADFSFSNSNDVDSIQNTLTGSGMRQRTSTLDLAQFLRTTSPPHSRGVSPTPPSRSNSVAKKLAMGFFRSSSSKSARNTPTPDQDRPVRLPDSVVPRTSANGAKYLLISVPTSLEPTVEEPSIQPHDDKAALDPAYNLMVSDSDPNPHSVEPLAPPSLAGLLNRPHRSGTMETESSAISAFRPFGATKEPQSESVGGQPPARSIQPSPALDEEVASTYHSFLKSQAPGTKKEESIRKAPSRDGLNSTRPNTASSFKADEKGHRSRASMGSAITEDESGPGKHSRALSVISDTPSYKSVSIHRDGIPSRTSSVKPTMPSTADVQAHLPAQHVGSVGSIPTSLNAAVLSAQQNLSHPHQYSQGQPQSQFAQSAASNRLPLPPQSDNRNSHASTAGSTAESIGASSDASSGIVMDAQVARSAGSVGYYNNNVRKPPRPGPAPTRALPSLPESRDDNGILRHRKSQGAMKPEIVHSTLTVPERMTIIESPIVTNFVEATSKPMFDASSRTNTMESTGSKGSSEKRRASSERASETPSPRPGSDALRNARKSREERVRARKMRDLQSIRARHENAKLDDTLSPQPRTERDSPSIRARNSLTSQSSLGTESSSGGSSTNRSSFRLSGTGSASSPNHRLSATGSVPAPLRRMSRSRRLAKNAVSPVMLVMEQEPATGLFQASNHGMSPILLKKRSVVSANGTPTPPRSPSPSLPSSDDDTLKRNSSKKTNNSHTPRTSISASAGGRSSMQSMTKGKEAEIDARFIAMERKNAVLEAALMAVLQTTAGFGQSSQSRLSTGSSQSQSQGRWSGSASSIQQSPSPLETLIQSMAATGQRE